MFEDYFNADLKQIGLFVSSITITVIIATILYWTIFGFSSWSKNINRAQDLMLAAANQNQTLCPQLQMPVNSTSLGNRNVSGQYICPQHGAVGLPDFDINGNPHCPLCGMIMTFTAAPDNRFQVNNSTVNTAIKPVAWGGGAGGAG